MSLRIFRVSGEHCLSAVLQAPMSEQYYELADSAVVLVERKQEETVAVERSRSARIQEGRNLVKRNLATTIHSEHFPAAAVHLADENPVASYLSLIHI